MSSSRLPTPLENDKSVLPEDPTSEEEPRFETSWGSVIEPDSAAQEYTWEAGEPFQPVEDDDAWKDQPSTEKEDDNPESAALQKIADYLLNGEPTDSEEPINLRTFVLGFQITKRKALECLRHHYSAQNVMNHALHIINKHQLHKKDSPVELLNILEQLASPDPPAPEALDLLGSMCLVAGLHTQMYERSTYLYEPLNTNTIGNRDVFYQVWRLLRNYFCHEFMNPMSLRVLLAHDWTSENYYVTEEERGYTESRPFLQVKELYEERLPGFGYAIAALEETLGDQSPGRWEEYTPTPSTASTEEQAEPVGAHDDTPDDEGYPAVLHYHDQQKWYVEYANHYGGAWVSQIGNPAAPTRFQDTADANDSAFEFGANFLDSSDDNNEASAASSSCDSNDIYRDQKSVKEKTTGQESLHGSERPGPGEFCSTKHRA